MHIILHKERQRLGILNLFANLFYLATEEYRYICKQEQNICIAKTANDVTKMRAIT